MTNITTFHPDGTVTVKPLLPPQWVHPLHMRKAIREIGLKATVDSHVATFSEEKREA